MRYKDKNTIKSNYHWQNKPANEIDNIGYQNAVNNELKKLIVPFFGKKINDSFWWNSLTKKEKFSVYIEYCNFEYYHREGNWWGTSGTTGYGPISIPKLPDISNEEHERRINTLKSKYCGDSSKRRDLVITEILS